MLVNRVLNATLAGFVAVLIGFTSSIALIYQMVINFGGDSGLAASWLLVLGLSLGVSSITLSLLYRIPILVAWSTPGAALLIGNAQGLSLNEAVAGFIFSATLIFFCGITGWFEKLMNKIPFQLATAMLAGVLVNFGIDVFDQMNTQPLLIIVMFVVYLVSKRFLPKYTMLFVLTAGVIVAQKTGLILPNEAEFTFVGFEYVVPHFTMQSVLGVGIPLFIVTIAAQNLPGIAVLKAHGYQAPISKVLSFTGLANIVAAPFGGYSLNLAAITAALCMTEDVDKDPGKRYWAAIAGGVFYILMGIFAGYLIGVFSTFPAALIFSLAGIALFSTITNSIKQSLSDDNYLEASMITFLVTASELSMLGISSVLWGLIAGIFTLFIMNVFRR
ncbi:benzoate/H(+) symporter BenE family transporter [Pseudocolwellia sp. HL-MZ7]|uniref:benzoate/H(+) symporter BenE family transporter n=1 Tax=Pseudocolwellia sp. HL-MZ7 TaxID=3400627 RepID=UPI003CF21499